MTSDYSLLRLSQPSPAGVYYLGWSTGSPAAGEILTGIHHPMDSFKRISFGRFNTARGNFWRCYWFSGVTEEGSSGSPIFNSQAQVIGQLYGGPSSCTDPYDYDEYGRFDVTYNAIRNWIDPSTPAQFAITGTPTLNGDITDVLTVDSGAGISGSFPYAVNNSQVQPGRIVTVAGFVNSAGQCVGGTPQVVYVNTPSASGETGTASWSGLSAPTVGGTYKLRFASYLGLDPMLCVTRFSTSPPVSDSGTMQGLIATIVVPATYPWTLWFQHTNGWASLWRMDGPTACSFQQARVGTGPVSTGWAAAGAADFDGNGSQDLLWQHTNGTISVWLFDGTNVLNRVRIGDLSASPGWRVGATGDLDGDGQPDILWQHTSGATAVWLMNGLNRLVSSRLNAPSGTGWRMAAAADVDGDGHLDILWQNASGAVGVWFMNGTNFIRSARLNTPAVGTNWQLVGTADLYQQGHADLIWQGTDGSLAYWLMDGINRTGSGRFNPGRIDRAWTIVGPR